MPRCTRCNAPLDAAPPGGGPGHEETARDPLGGQGQGQGQTPGPRQPPPTPWAESPPGPPWSQAREPTGPDEETTALSPEPWASSPAPDSGETAVSLSPEPWAAAPLPPLPPPPSSGESTLSLSQEPWEEPAIWQPPPPRKRKPPYLLIVAGVVMLAAVALGIVFWPSGAGKTADTAGGSAVPQQSQGAPGTEVSAASDPATTGADLTQQAREVDALLSEMASTRSELGSVVVAGCERGALERIRDRRQGQLDRARTLKVDAMDGGTELKSALVRALEASSESNQRYVDVAPGCPSDGEVSDVNQRASDAKTEFIGYWNAVAEKAGLPARSSDLI